MPLFTIFIPTYNRDHTLPRALQSVSAQQDMDLEVVIVDDGSTDNTLEIISQWQTCTTFPVIYIYQNNQGKTAAHNTMLEYATGELTVLLDSDDLLTSHALTSLRKHWDKVKEIPDCAGIETLCADLSNHEILGTPYPQDEMLGNYLEMRHHYDIRGDKFNVVKTSVLKQFPFPRFTGEKHVPESIVWGRIAHHYRFLHLNEILKLVEYQADGISHGWSDKKSRNPLGFRHYYLEILNDHRRFYTLGERITAAKRYAYLSFLNGTPFSRQLGDIDLKLLYLLCFPAGAIRYLLQRLKQAGHKNGD